MRVLLVSTYELGHQPLHVASPAAALLAAGHDVRALDLSVEAWDEGLVDWADRVAFSVPMHTAMRLAIRAARRVKAVRPDLPVCFYGLYAPVSRDLTVGALADRVIAGEYEGELVRWVGGGKDPGRVVFLGRDRFSRPARHLLPPLERYSHLHVGDESRLAGYVEASHGCVHRCRHCPVPVVYDGRTRIVDVATVVADVAQLVAMGAHHVTFGDPDFLNGPHHSLRVVRAVHAAFPDVTFDITAKVEHILRHDGIWEELAAAGCLFVVSAFESVNDEQLRLLDKGHTVADASRAVWLLREHGIEPRPSFLPFLPTTTLPDVAAMVEFIAALDLAGNVDPVQLTIRLLLPEGSLLCDRPEIRPYVGDYDAEGLTYRWRSADPAVDALQDRLAARAEAGATLDELCETILHAAGRRPVALVDHGRAPRLTEPWFC